jgi:hypothetical protein
LPFRFILPRSVEKCVDAESDQQYLGTGPGDHGSGESAAVAEQQHQSAVGGEQQRNREKYGGRKPISKPGHAYSIDAGLIDELSPSQPVPAGGTILAHAIGIYPEYTETHFGPKVPKCSQRKHASRTHAPSTGRIGGNLQWTSSAFYSLGSQTHWLFFDVNGDGTGLH